MDLTRLLTSTTGTIPAAQSISTYTATTDATDSSMLQVTGGTVNLMANGAITWTTATGNNFPTQLNDGTCSLDGYYYIFIAAGTPKIAKIIGITQVSLIGGVYTYAFQLDHAMTGVTAQSFSIIIGNDVSYSYSNTGGADATIDGTTVAAGTTNAFPTKGQPSTNNLYRPVYVDASSTTVSIQESNLNPSI